MKGMFDQTWLSSRFFFIMATATYCFLKLRLEVRHTTRNFISGSCRGCGSNRMEDDCPDDTRSSGGLPGGDSLFDGCGGGRRLWKPEQWRGLHTLIEAHVIFTRIVYMRL